MKLTPPLRIIVPPPLLIAYQWGKEIANNYFFSIHWPDWIPYALIAFMIGSLVSDIYNPRSWLRQWWRESRRLFYVQALFTGHQVVGPERVELICILKFEKKVKNASVVVREITSPVGHGIRSMVVFQKENLSFEKDSKYRLVFGNLAVPQPVDKENPKSANHNIYGDVPGGINLLPEQNTIHQSSIVEISVNHQSYKLYLKLLDLKREDHIRVILIGEDEYPNLID